MKNTYFSISATLEQLLSRMHEYAQMTLPSEFEDMRPDAKEPLQIWPGDGLAWSGTFYAVSTVEDDVPFFEMAVQEVDGTCRVRIRCLDPKAAKWVRDMIVWLAPGRASGSVQPLPDLPARSTAPEPPVAASMETNLPSLQPSSHNEPGQLPEPPQTPPPSPDRGASEASHLGRASLPDEYKKHQVEAFHKVRGFMNQVEFCRGKPFRPRTLRSWKPWYEKKYGPL